VRVVKGALDRLLALLGLVFLSPVFAGLALWIVIESGRPVIFRQTRAGKDAKPFSMLKFRTMVANAVELGRELKLSDDPFGLLPNDPRITRSGRFLRRTSLDELPQLWNVLRGQMSLVGPRPLIPHEHQFVNDWGLRRLDLTPGLTGLWQVCGRSEVTFSQMLVLDYLYVTNWSLWGDIKLIMRTVPALMGKTRGAV